jgi:hypothetical protein
VFRRDWARCLGCYPQELDGLVVLFSCTAVQHSLPASVREFNLKGTLEGNPSIS